MKYFSKKVTYYGKTFDSRAELNRYLALKDKEKKGEIKELQRQVAWELLPKQVRHDVIQLKTKTKVVERVEEKAVLYHCDFYYYDNIRQKYVIEEVKSKVTAQVRDYPLRRKLVKLMVKRENEKMGCEWLLFNEIIH